MSKKTKAYSITIRLSEADMDAIESAFFVDTETMSIKERNEICRRISRIWTMLCNGIDKTKEGK